VPQNTEPVTNFCERSHEPSNYMKGGDCLDSLSAYSDLKPNSAPWSYGNMKSALPCYVTITASTSTLYYDIDRADPLKNLCRHCFTHKLA